MKPIAKRKKKTNKKKHFDGGFVSSGLKRTNKWLVAVWRTLLMQIHVRRLLQSVNGTGARKHAAQVGRSVRWECVLEAECFVESATSMSDKREKGRDYSAPIGLCFPRLLGEAGGKADRRRTEDQRGTTEREAQATALCCALWRWRWRTAVYT